MRRQARNFFRVVGFGFSALALATLFANTNRNPFAHDFPLAGQFPRQPLFNQLYGFIHTI